MPDRTSTQGIDYVSEPSKVPKNNQMKGWVLEKLFARVLDDLKEKEVNLDYRWHDASSHSDGGHPDFEVVYGDRKLGFDTKNLRPQSPHDNTGIGYGWVERNILSKFDESEGERYLVVTFLTFRDEDRNRCVRALERAHITVLEIGTQVDTNRVYNDDMRTVYPRLMRLVCEVLGISEWNRYSDFSHFAPAPILAERQSKLMLGSPIS